MKIIIDDGQQYTIYIDDSPEGKAFLDAYLYQINYRDTIPDPDWMPTVDDGQGNQIANPDLQGQVPNPDSRGKAIKDELLLLMKKRALMGAGKIDEPEVAIAKELSATTSKAVQVFYDKLSTPV